MGKVIYEEEVFLGKVTNVCQSNGREVRCPNLPYVIGGKGTEFDCEMIAGYVRRSASLRSSTSSLFPVPLNSSKITSSMREPVSISAVADDRQAAALLDVARRAEKAFRLLERVAASMPPDQDAYPSAAPRRCRRGAMRVMESSRMTTSRLVLDHALRLLDDHLRDVARGATAGSSKVDEITSAFTVFRSMSVTSSGRSSMRRMIRSHLRMVLS